MKISLLPLALSVCVLTRTAAPADSDARLVKPIVLKDLPPLDWHHYKFDPYITAAALLQAQGQKTAGETLTRLARKEHTADLAGKEHHGEKLVVLCRMLYVAKPKKEFRWPGLGKPMCLGGTYENDWPLGPIEIVNGVPFLITPGYELAGLAEPPMFYVAYCRESCGWNPYKFAPKTAIEKQKALDKLLTKPVWKKPLPETEREFFTAQVK